MDSKTSDKAVKFDGTINLGHILTFVGFILTIFIGWTTLDKRVVVLEEARHAQAMVDNHQNATVQQYARQTQDSITEIKQALIRMETKMDKPK